MNTEKKVRILVVDDEESVRRLLRDIIASRGYDVLTAENGKQALDLVAKHEDLTLIVTDLVMPELNGIDLIVSIREIRPDIGIIAISGGGGITGRFDYLPVAKLIGAQHVLNKPFDPDELVSAINSQLG